MRPTEVESIAACLADAADGWLRGDWEGQDELVTRISVATGFQQEVVVAGIAGHFMSVSLAELRRWQEAHRNPPCADSGTGQSAGGRVAVLPAGNIPGVALIPAMAALLAGAEVVIKTSRSEPWLMKAWRDRLSRFDLSVAERIAVDTWRSDEPGSLERVDDCDRVILLGSDETIEQLAPRLGPRLIGLGTGTSLAVVGGTADPAVVGQALARDIAIWDQAGCLSPQELVVIGTRNEALAMAERLAVALQQIESLLPAGPLSLAESARRRGFVAELAARRVADGDLPTWLPPDDSSDWMVWLDNESGFAMAPVRRHVAVRYVPAIQVLVESALPPVAHRQGVGLDPGDPLCGELAHALQAAGVPVILPLGSMQSPPVDWPNKGHDLLAELMETLS